MRSSPPADRSPAPARPAPQPSAALSGASRAFQASPAPAPAPNTYSGRNGALAAATKVGRADRAAAPATPQPPAATGALARLAAPSPVGASKSREREHTQSPSLIAATLAASRATPAPASPTAASAAAAARPRAPRTPEPATDESPIPATRSLVEMFEAGAARQPVQRSPQPILSPVPLRPARPMPEPTKHIRARPRLSPSASSLSSEPASPVDRPPAKRFVSRPTPPPQRTSITTAATASPAARKLAPPTLPAKPAPPVLLPIKTVQPRPAPPTPPAKPTPPALPPIKTSQPAPLAASPVSSPGTDSDSDSDSDAYASAEDTFPRPPTPPRSRRRRSTRKPPRPTPPAPPPPRRPLSAAALRRPPTTTMAPLSPHPAARLKPQLTADSLADAMVASSLASSRAPSPSREILTRRGSTPLHHKTYSFSLLVPGSPLGHEAPASPRPLSPLKGMRRTMRRAESGSSDGRGERSKSRDRRHGLLVRKHPHKHAEGDRRRWRDAVTAAERKRYEGVWAANRGILAGAAADDVHAYAVRDLWARSALDSATLEQIWDLVAAGGHPHEGRRTLRRDEFVVGLWLVDQSLKGRRLPVDVSESVWSSARGLTAGIRAR